MTKVLLIHLGLPRVAIGKHVFSEDRTPTWLRAVRVLTVPVPGCVSVAYPYGEAEPA